MWRAKHFFTENTWKTVALKGEALFTQAAPPPSTGAPQPPPPPTSGPGCVCVRGGHDTTPPSLPPARAEAARGGPSGGRGRVRGRRARLHKGRRGREEVGGRGRGGTGHLLCLWCPGAGGRAGGREPPRPSGRTGGSPRGRRWSFWATPARPGRSAT